MLRITFYALFGVIQCMEIIRIFVFAISYTSSAYSICKCYTNVLDINAANKMLANCSLCHYKRHCQTLGRVHGEEKGQENKQK